MAALVALWSVVVVMALILVGLLRRMTNVLEQAEARLAQAATGFGGAPPGTAIPPFEVKDEQGSVLRFAQLVGSPAIYLFMSSTCEPCKRLAAELSGIDQALDRTPLFLIMEDSPEAREVPFPPGVTVLYQAEQAASRAFQNVAAPQAFAVDSGGTVLDLLIPNSLGDLRQLVRRIEGGERKEVQETKLAL